jgi:hypothetical protein
MTAEQWQIALRIYSTAQEIALEERRAFIDSVTVDPEVVQQVLDLLETDFGTRSAVISVDRTGTRTGRYEIGKLLGRGAVWARLCCARYRTGHSSAEVSAFRS